MKKTMLFLAGLCAAIIISFSACNSGSKNKIDTTAFFKDTNLTVLPIPETSNINEIFVIKKENGEKDEFTYKIKFVDDSGKTKKIEFTTRSEEYYICKYNGDTMKKRDSAYWTDYLRVLQDSKNNEFEVKISRNGDILDYQVWAKFRINDKGLKVAYDELTHYYQTCLWSLIMSDSTDQADPIDYRSPCKITNL